MGYEDTLPRSTCNRCGKAVVLVPGYGWKHDDDDGYGVHYYECPRCGTTVITDFISFFCPYCGERLENHHEAEVRWR